MKKPFTIDLPSVPKIMKSKYGMILLQSLSYHESHLLTELIIG